MDRQRLLLSNDTAFFSSPMDWLGMNLILLRILIIGIPDSGHYVLAVDEVVEKKAGKHTWGVDWFYSSIAGRPIRSVSNHTISVVDTEKEYSFVLTHEQTVKPVQESKTGGKKKNKLAKTKNKSKSKVNTEQQKPGRPKGSKNKQNVKKKGH